MNKTELQKILENHAEWLADNNSGERAILSYANLSGADLSGVDLSYAKLSGVDLSYANLSGVDLSGANLSDANLPYANLSGANLSGANLSGANLSGADGMLSSLDFLSDNFEKCKDGYIAYKTFNSKYSAPQTWEIKSGAIISENCNANRVDDCGCGINVATMGWVVKNYSGNIWKVLIRWEWCAGIVVPYMTDGKIRCARCELLEIVGGN